MLMGALTGHEGEYFFEDWINVHDFYKLGGRLEPGAKLTINPREPKASKQYTFVEIVPGEGVRVKELDVLAGTGWTFVRKKFRLA